MSDSLVPAFPYAFSWHAVPYFAAALLIGATGALIWRWERGNRVSWFFAAIAAVFSAWAIARGMMRLSAGPEQALSLARAAYSLVSLLLPLMYQFICIILHIEKQRLVWIRANWVLGVLMLLLAYLTPWVVSGLRQLPWGLEPVHAIFGYAMVVWIGALIMAATSDLVRAYRSASPGSVERNRLGLLGAGMLCLYTALGEFGTASGLAIYPTGFLSVAAFTVVTAIVAQRYGLVEVTAQLAADAIAGMIRGALLILDRDCVVQVVNERTEDVLGLAREKLVGQNARAILGDAFTRESLTALAGSDAQDLEKELLYVHPQSTQPRDLALSAVAVKDRHQHDVAYVCLLRDITERKRAQRQRMIEGLTDALTGLPNRAMLQGLLDVAVARSNETGNHQFALCFIGMDRLHVINEDLGYASGDQVLMEVAQRLKRIARPRDTVARVGGDEFCILLESIQGPDSTRDFLRRLESALQAPIRLSDHDIYPSASIGMVMGQGYANGTDLLRSAGIAMFRVKEQGGGGAKFVSAGEQGAQRTRLEADLRRALDAREFQVYYQPIVDLDERRITSFEALVRWQHPERGLLPPAEFMDFAEEVGLVSAIDRHVFGQACADIGRLQKLFRDRRLSVSVNLMEDGLREPDLVERIEDLLAQHGLEPNCLRVELHERVAQTAPVADTLRRLREIGVGVYIDDFGTGYSSLSRLHELPVSVLKVDRDFVRAMALGGSGEKIVNSIIGLAQNLGLGVIAEGAASADDVRRLHDFGCRQVQGFYFSKAVPFEAAADLLRNPQALNDKFIALSA